MSITLISFIFAVVVAVFSSITAPLILAHRTERMHREDRQADWDRQDAVAKAAADAADRLVAAQEEAARLLLADNARVAAAQEQTNGKLDVIHTLVNSNMTAEMQRSYDATKRELAVMRELMELRKANGLEPTPAVLAEIAATEITLNELDAALADRRQAQEHINSAEGTTTTTGAGT